MLQSRDLVEHQYDWRIRKGNSNIWFDNWIKEGDLYNLVENPVVWEQEYQMVQGLIQEGQWKIHVIT